MPACGATTAVVDSRGGAGYIRRRRLCNAEGCGQRLWTIESVVPGKVMESTELLQALKFYAALEALPVHEQKIVRSILSVLRAREQPAVVVGSDEQA